MRGLVGNIQIGHPGPDEERDDYWSDGRGALLVAMYGELLGMRHIFVGYHKLVHEDGRTPEIGFEYAPEDPPPRWRDPDHPQQVHLDIAVRDLDGAEDLALSRGATKLDGFEDHRVLADAVGHPFCLYPDRRGDRAMITARRQDRARRFRLLQPTGARIVLRGVPRHALAGGRHPPPCRRGR